MAIKVYLKKGNLNYKERKYISAIQKNLEAKGIQAKDFNPATNFSELEQLHNMYGAEDVEFEEVKNDAKEVSEDSSSADDTSNEEDAYEKHRKFRDSVGKQESTEIATTNNDIVDPFNQAEPIVRDYVKSGSIEDPNEQKTTNQTTFEEPTTWGDSFELPSGDGGGSGSGSGNGGGGKKGGSVLGAKKENDKDKKVSEPLNPALDGVSQARKRKSTKKMAKAIVFGVCKLAEFGCNWWVTKDITEDKLVEYEINDTMDLQMLLALDENQQITVRNWFTMQVKNANDELKVDEGSKEDMADSLYEVLLEKGIAPSPTQELMIDAVSSLVIGLGLKAFAMQKQIASVLGQLTALRKEQKEQGIGKTNQNNFQNQEQEEEPSPLNEEVYSAPQNNQSMSIEDAEILSESEQFASDVSGLTIIED
jgi:hypothetical protein